MPFHKKRTPQAHTTEPVQMSASHRRVLSVRLRTLEKYCNQILDAMSGLLTTGVLEERVNDLLPEEKEKVRGVVLRIKEGIQILSEEIDLERSRSDIRRTIRSLVSAMWVDLEETKSESLRGYGQVPEPFKEFWDPQVDALLEEVHRLEGVLDQEK